ncbi:uncharacterized protein LOC121838157 [Ixodes scapularis]|uniref:uncharacterized protein LOC121838157 n=1 Tax=Ixodes scapularis TaxID=6945 RepID=UPI001C3836AC|nr:uncharacterized protein LOC121838157 [Ixodes scapularis]
MFISRQTLLKLRLRTLGLCVRKNVVHPSVFQALGFHSHNWSSGHRIMQISRKELSEELRLTAAVLPGFMTSCFGPSYGKHASFIFLQEAAAQLLESSWRNVIAGVATSSRANTSSGFDPPINISGVELSENTKTALSCGPKFAPDSQVSRIDQLAAVHQVASTVPEKERHEFLGAAVRSVCTHPVPAPSTKFSVKSAVDELRSSDLKLLEADKTGGFVVMGEDQYRQRVEQALDKNFRRVKGRPSGSVRSRVKELCSELNLPKLKSSVMKPSKQYLSLFFSAKTHKPELPFRSIVSEGGSWQKPVALFLQKHLSLLTPSQPFRIRNSNELITVLTPLHNAPVPLSVFSYDIEDMYYSLDIPFLIKCVDEAINEFGLCRFQNASGIPLSGFIQLLQLYLRSTMIEQNGEVFIQKSGVCIGSCLAPVLSEIYLSFVDRTIDEELRSIVPGCQVVRYVDDYLVIHPTGTPVHSISPCFLSAAGSLNFKREDPTEEGLQYLDIRLNTTETGICWAFRQRSEKPVLPFSSSHSRSVKTGVVTSLITSARSRSCSHHSTSSVKTQFNRLLKAGYPMDLLSSVTQRLIVNRTPRTSRAAPGGRIACIPYMHNVAHRVKSLASRFGTKVIFKCRFKLGSMCKLVNNASSPPACAKKHGSQFVRCAKEKVYSIPLTCGAEYIGQTGRCINDRLREHHIACASQPEGSLHPIIVHGKECQACTPLFNETKVVGGHRERYGREIIEAYRMTTTKNNIASPSLSLTKPELVFLRPAFSRTPSMSMMETVVMFKVLLSGGSANRASNP